MTFTITLTKNDIVTQYLYMLSVNKDHKKKRMRMWLMFPAIYVVFIVMELLQGKPFNYWLLGLGLFWMVAYPFYSRWNYKRYYTKYVTNNLQNRIGVATEVTVTNTAINFTEADSATNIKSDAVEVCVAIPDYYIMKLKTQQYLVMPKAAITNTTDFEGLLHNMNIAMEYKPNWRWK